MNNYKNYNSNKVGSTQIAAAKTVDLVQYLLHNYPHLIRYNEKSKRYLHSEHDSCVICNIGFYRFSTGDRGDQIQFLENYCNMCFQDAVRTLANYSAKNTSACISVDTPKHLHERHFKAPEALNGQYKCVWTYLVRTRKIPREIVERLFDEGTLYQSNEYQNCVFLSNTCKYAEIVGTTHVKFKKIEKDSDEDGFWLVGDKNSDTVYVCESSIDAISLMLLHQKYVPQEKACYASMGGLKDQAIEHLKSIFKTVIIAIDNDYSADEFREKHPDLFNIIPPEEIGSNDIKDWNDVLCHDNNVGLIKNNLTEKFTGRHLPF